MAILEKIMDNFFGASYSDQKEIYSTMINSLDEPKFKHQRKDLNSTFAEYFETLENLLSFEELYKSFNSDKRRITRKFAIKALIEQAEWHHTDHSESNRGHYFIYSSEGFTKDDKIREYLRYFKPQSISEEEVREFLATYASMDLESKSEFVEDMTFSYDRLNYFKLPCNSNILKHYKSIIQSMIGDDLMLYYDNLYPEEQIRLIIEVVNKAKKLNTEEFVSRMKAEMANKPKYIRNLKKEAKYYCQRINTK